MLSPLEGRVRSGKYWHAVLMVGLFLDASSGCHILTLQQEDARYALFAGLCKPPFRGISEVEQQPCEALGLPGTSAA